MLDARRRPRASRRARVHILLDGRDVGETERPRVRRALRGLPGGAQRRRRLRLPHRLGRRPHVHHHGPLRRRLGHGRARLGRPRAAARARHVRERQGGHRDLPRRRPGIIDQDLPRVRHRRETASRSARSRTATRSSTSTSAATAPSRSPRAFEEDEFDKFDRGRRPEVQYAGMMEYDGDLKMPRALPGRCRPAIDRTMGEYLAHTGVTPVRDLRDPEVRPRHLFLQRQPHGQVRREARDLRRDPVRRRALRAAALDEVRRDHRHGDRGDQERQVPLPPPQLPQRRHGRPHRQLPGRGHGSMEALDLQLGRLLRSSARPRAR